jgi:hypothetical protein
MRLDPQVNLTGHQHQRSDALDMPGGPSADQLLGPCPQSARQHRPPARAPHEVVTEVVRPASPNPHLTSHASQYAGAVCQTRRTAIHPSPERDNPLAEG